MVYPAPTKGFSWANPDTAMLFTPFGPTHLPFPLTQNLSPKDIAGYDVKLKLSWCVYAWLVVKGLKMIPNFEIFFRMCICGTALAQIGRLLLKSAGFVCMHKSSEMLCSFTYGSSRALLMSSRSAFVLEMRQLQKWFLQMCVSCIDAYCNIVFPGNTVVILAHMYVYVSCITVRSLTTFSRWSTHTTAWLCGHVMSWGGVTLLVMCVTM